MDGQRFDDMTRALTKAQPSRRRVLRGLLAGGAAGLAALAGIGRAGPATAAEPRFCQRTYNADPKTIASKNACGVTRCGNNETCFCVQTVGHTPRCLTGFDPTAGQRDCPTEDECGERRPCPNGRFCAKAEGCCGQPFKVCLRSCPSPS